MNAPFSCGVATLVARNANEYMVARMVGQTGVWSTAVGFMCVYQKSGSSRREDIFTLNLHE
jgi:hypothetical protein